MKKGIDISTWQNNVDYNALAQDDVDFVILRAGFGSPDPSQIDAQFNNHLNGCKSVGLPTGAYHYGYATSEDEARGEAQFCLDILSNEDMQYGVWYDIEERCMYDVGRDQLTAIANAFCEVIQNAGYKAGVYMNLNCANNYVNMDEIPYYKWIAQYNDECTYQGHYDIWQYTSDGDVSGINGRVDMDYCYTDFEEPAPPEPQPAPQPEPQPAPEPPKDVYEWIFDDTQKKWGLKKNGNWVYDKWVQLDGKWYAINKQGWLITQGWYKEGNYWYYLDKQKGEMKIGWLWLDDEYGKGWYYFDENGHLIQDGWKWDNDYQAWYYLKCDGKMATKEFVHTPQEMSKYWVNENGKWMK